MRPGPEGEAALRPSSRLTPVMSDGIRSGVNWMRRNSRPSARLSARTSSVLAVPGTPSSSTCPRARSAEQRFAKRGVLPQHHACESSAEHPVGRDVGAASRASSSALSVG